MRPVSDALLIPKAAPVKVVSQPLCDTHLLDGLIVISLNICNRSVPPRHDVRIGKTLS